MGTSRFLWYYTKLIIALGFVTTAISLYQLPLAQLDISFWVLALLTLVSSSRISIPIPPLGGHLTISDTFIFLTMLLYGGEAAVLLAASEGLYTPWHLGRRPSTVVLNGSLLSLTTFITYLTMQLFFGSIQDLSRSESLATFVVAMCVLGVVQYVVNSGLAAVYAAFKKNEKISYTWNKYYLWSSITHLAGASTAGIVSRLIDRFGFYYIVLTTPIIIIIYLTYKTYLKNIEASASQAEQAERERMREHYSQMEKLSALGELSSGVAHNFNNTLTGILGRAQILLETKDYAEIRRGLQIIIRTAEDGAKTVKRIQDFARQRRDQVFAPVDVDQLMIEIGEITRPRWKDRAEAANVHIALNRQINSNVLIMGDAGELREVLVNMVFNAIDAMPEGGQLTLSTRKAKAEEMVEIIISDTGHGMTEEVRSRIFDPFFTTKGNAGMGLGLSVSYGIITRHEGTIEVESEVGRGTTFRIKFPVASAAVTPVPDPVALPSALVHPTTLRILVVDDEDYVRELLSDILEREGCKVVLAAESLEALALFEAQEFDAVLTDVGLPGMSGWELARAIRARDQHIPLAVITGWGDTITSEKQATVQANWIIPKPFSIERIASLVQEISERQAMRETHNQTSVAS